MGDEDSMEIGRAARVQPEQQAPPVQRLRVRYAKRGRMRFTSSRDFARAFERALQRARVPMAYSSGFSPHPRISYASGAPTGAASEAEYLEIALAETVEPAAVREALTTVMPDGLDIVEVVDSGGEALADLLQASAWRIELPEPEGPVGVAAAAEAFLAAGEVVVERLTKKGVRSFDARQAVASLRAEGAAVEVVIRHGEPLVRPDDVVSGLVRSGLVLPEGRLPLYTRLAQGRLDEAAKIVAV